MAGLRWIFAGVLERTASPLKGELQECVVIADIKDQRYRKKTTPESDRRLRWSVMQ
jgi:hypothetical protein